MSMDWSYVSAWKVPVVEDLIRVYGEPVAILCEDAYKFQWAKDFALPDISAEDFVFNMKDYTSQYCIKVIGNFGTDHFYTGIWKLPV